MLTAFTAHPGKIAYKPSQHFACRPSACRTWVRFDEARAGWRVLPCSRHSRQTPPSETSSWRGEEVVSASGSPPSAPGLPSRPASTPPRAGSRFQNWIAKTGSKRSGGWPCLPIPPTATAVLEWSEFRAISAVTRVALDPSRLSLKQRFAKAPLCKPLSRCPGSLAG